MDPQIQSRIVALALRQQNNVTWEQLLELGVGPGAIKYRARTRRYFRPHQGVYSLGHPPQTPHQKAMAAVLACGPNAVLSHDSALALWGLKKRWPTTLEVTTTRDRRPKRIKVHLTKRLPRQDITKHHSIPVTTPARTLKDCAPRLTDKALARAVNDAFLSSFLTKSQLAEFLRRTPCSRLTPFVTTDDGPTRSQFEDAFKAFCKRYGFPEPRFNIKMNGYLVDAYFEAEKVIVELDGWRYHSNRQTFESDRLRDADNLASGIVTFRQTWTRLTASPAKEAERLQRILSARRPDAARATRAAQPARRRAPGRPAR